jgi:thioredoxin reductase
MDAYDIVVVGGGAAGLSAALVLGRALRKVAVVDAGEPRNAPATHMHGFLSRDGMAPADLIAAGRAEIAGYGVDLIAARVSSVTSRVDGVSPGWMIRLEGGREVGARRILVATGLRDDLPDLPGLRQLWGRDVLHCPYCHGYEVRDASVGVIANPEGQSLHQAVMVRQWVRDVVFFAHTTELSTKDRQQLAARGISIVEGTVTALIGQNGRLSAVELAGGERVERQAVFVAPRFVPQDELLRKLGCDVKDGWVTVDGSGQTSVAGVWAAGNVVDPRLSVIGAAGAASGAAMALNFDLVQEDLARELGALA